MAVAPIEADTPLWDPLTRSFNRGRLQLAITARGLTRAELASMSRLTLSTVHKALRGEPLREDTAIAILQVLDKRQPMEILRPRGAA